MKTRIGVLGSKDTLDKIKEVSNNFEEKAEFIYYNYDNNNETVKILNSYQNTVDVILFGGISPYYVGKSANVIKKPSIYLPRNGSCLYKMFWEIRNNNLDYSKLSVDSTDRKSVEEVAKELNISLESLYIKKYPVNINYEEIFDFHYNLWKTGKTNVIITGLTYIVEKMKLFDIPVFKLYPTTNIIQQYINKAIYLSNVEKIKATQGAFQIMKIRNKAKKIPSEYDFLSSINKFEKILINYTREILGSFFPFKRDEYIIFTTRGALDNIIQIDHIQNFFKELNKLNIVVSSGIGFGNTLQEAEANGRTALEKAMKKNHSCLFIVDEYKHISGPISEQDKLFLSYDLVVNDEKINKIAKNLNTSGTYILKIKMLAEKSTNHAFDAEQMANYLGISARSARRIINQLLDQGYARILAKENKDGPGRPKRIFEILF